MTDIRIYSYRDARFWESIIKEQYIKSPEMLAEAKRALRKYYHKPARDHILVRDNGIDGYVERFPLPEYIASKDEAVEYFREYEYIHYRPSMYDCTGQSFTSWFKVYQAKDGRFWAYHSVGIDC